VSAPTPPDAVRQLSALAEEAGEPDNFTMVVIDVGVADAKLELAEPITLGSAAAESVAH
jgi:serine/threonine protein phosphatase PrpC